MLCWHKKGNPADNETRGLRRKCHALFDPLWKLGGYKRNDLYRQLSEYMGKSRKETHFSMFGKEDCELALEFIFEVYDSNFFQKQAVNTEQEAVAV